MRSVDKIIWIEKTDGKQFQNQIFFQLPLETTWVDNTLKQMGYPHSSKANKDILKKTHRLISGVGKEISPHVLLKSQLIDSISKNGFDAKNFSINSSKWGKILSKLKDPKEVCCFGLSLGQNIEDINKKLANESLVEGFIWDALCSTLAEYYADQTEAYLASLYELAGLQITRRFSPGYCDIPLLSGQSAIFNFCNMDKIGITISKSGLMTPRKSITGMVIASPLVPVKQPCSFCKNDCDHRRELDF